MWSWIRKQYVSIPTGSAGFFFGPGQCIRIGGRAKARITIHINRPGEKPGRAGIWIHTAWVMDEYLPTTVYLGS